MGINFLYMVGPLTKENTVDGICVAINQMTLIFYGCLGLYNAQHFAGDGRRCGEQAMVQRPGNTGAQELAKQYVAVNQVVSLSEEETKMLEVFETSERIFISRMRWLCLLHLVWFSVTLARWVI